MEEGFDVVDGIQKIIDDTPTEATSRFAQVIFPNCSEVYEAGTDIDLDLKVTDLIEKSTSDKIGLFYVGWITHTDWIATAPVLDDHAVFTRDVLPGASTNHYQFCYLSDGVVRGASIPFMITDISLNSSSDMSVSSLKASLPSTGDDFEAIEEEESGIMVVKSRLDILREHLQMAQTTNRKLKEKIEMLKEERDNLMVNIVEFEQKCADHKVERVNWMKETQVMNEEMHILEESVKDRTKHNELLLKKIADLNQDVDNSKSRLDDSDKYICSMQGKLKHLVSEKDLLTGANKILEQEKQMLQKHISDLEQDQSKAILEVTLLKTQIDEQKVEACDRMDVAEEKERQIKKLTADLSAATEMIVKVQNQLQESYKMFEAVEAELTAEKLRSQRFSEQLQASEDKLDAVLNVKQILEEEVMNIRNAKDAVKEENEMLCSQLKGNKHALEIQQAHAEEFSDAIKEVVAEKENRIETLEEMLKTREEKMSEKERDNENHKAALYQMKQVHVHLEAKLKEETKQSEQLKAQLQELSLTLDDVKAELEDTTQRLSMGTTEYKSLYMKYERLRHEKISLEKQVPKQRSTTVGCIERSSATKATKTEEQRTQTLAPPKTDTNNQATDTVPTPHEGKNVLSSVSVADAATNSDPPAAKTNASTSTTPTPKGSASSKQPVDKYKKKKRMYKEKYLSEVKQNEMLRTHYHDELKGKTMLITDLRAEIELLRVELGSYKAKEAAAAKQPIPSPSPQSPASLAATAAAAYSLISPQLHDPDRCPLASTAGMELQQREVESESDGESLPELEEEGEIESTAVSAPMTHPLTPLPAPMQPERLPSAKLAAVKAINTGMPETVADIPQTQSPGEAIAVYSTVPFFPQDEQFVDASDTFESTTGTASSSAHNTPERKCGAPQVAEAYGAQVRRPKAGTVLSMVDMTVDHVKKSLSSDLTSGSIIDGSTAMCLGGELADEYNTKRPVVTASPIEGSRPLRPPVTTCQPLAQPTAPPVHEEGVEVFDDLETDFARVAHVEPHLLSDGFQYLRAPEGGASGYDADSDAESDHYRDYLPSRSDKTCPICQKDFSHMSDYQEFTLHIEEHYKRECPVCCEHFTTVSQQEFEIHVQNHLD